MIYGYARVSTGGQNTATQFAELQAAGAKKIFRDVMSGARSDRPQLQKMLAALETGDTVLISRLDRLARSTLDLLHILDQIAKKGAAFRSLADVWADTTTPHGRLMLTMLAGLAEFERELIRQRTGQGRRAAKARGVKFGRPRTLTFHQQQEAIQRRKRGELLTQIARSYNVSPSTISRLTP